MWENALLKVRSLVDGHGNAWPVEQYPPVGGELGRAAALVSGHIGPGSVQQLHLGCMRKPHSIYGLQECGSKNPLQTIPE